MTREELKQYRALLRECDELKRRIRIIEKKERVSDTVVGSSPFFPYAKRTFYIEGMPEDESVKLKRLKKTLEISLRRAEEMLDDIVAFIESIEDARVRTVFRLRYYDEKSWATISMHLHSTHESYARKLHDRYLQQL